MPIYTYSVHQIIPYINWIYFFHAWHFPPRFATIATLKDMSEEKWVQSFAPHDREQARQAIQLHKDACGCLAYMEGKSNAQTIFKLCTANSEGDDLLLDGVRFPTLRQQQPHTDNSPMLCLADFVRPRNTGQTDKVCVFASTFHDKDIVASYQTDPYSSLLSQTLSDRLAEAAAEYLHLYVRTKAWGYAPDETLTIDDLLKNKYQGIRPAIGYPSLPDQSVIFIIDQLLHLEQIGISLTHNGAMVPHASVCGLMLAHPAASYFNIGKIGTDQLHDYSQRRGMTIENMEKFIGHLL